MDAIRLRMIIKNMFPVFTQRYIYAD